MATRALIGYLNPSNSITTTYNHYDGYPENLGVALKKHYSTDEKAEEIANMGYVSYVDPETGYIEANNTERPRTIGDSDLMSSLQRFKDEASEADYAYLYAPVTGTWMHAPTAMKMEDFVDVFLRSIDFMDDEDDMADYDSIDSMEEGYEAKWKNFISEGPNNPALTMQKAFDQLKQNEPKEMVSAYEKSLANDIRLNGKEQYMDFSVEDFIEDYNEYVNDKMDF